MGSGMRTTDPATSGLVRMVVVLVAIAVSTSLLIVRSDAAFTAQTQSVDNTLGSGRVKLTDNVAEGTVLFEVDGMVPGEVAQRCIRVEYAGTVAQEKLSPLRLSVTGAGALGTYLTTSIEMGTTGTADAYVGDEETSCDGFGGTVSPLYNTLEGADPALDLGALVGTHDTYADGLGTAWTPDGLGDTRWFRITFVLQDDDDAQYLTATPSFSWELHSETPG